MQAMSILCEVMQLTLLADQWNSIALDKNRLGKKKGWSLPFVAPRPQKFPLRNAKPCAEHSLLHANAPVEEVIYTITS